MAVLNKYTDAKIVGDSVTKLLSMVNAGSNAAAMYATFEVAAADDDGSVFRVFKDVDPNLIPTSILVACDAITGGTSWAFGIYAPNLGAAIAANVFMTAQTFASAIASLNPKTAIDGMAAVVIENYGRRLFEHAGHDVTTKLKAYDLAFTATTIGTVAGTVSVIVNYVQG